MTIYGVGPTLGGANGNGYKAMLYRRYYSGDSFPPMSQSAGLTQYFAIKLFNSAGTSIATYTGAASANAVQDLVDTINADAASPGYGYLEADFHSESLYYRGGPTFANADEFTNGV